MQNRRELIASALGLSGLGALAPRSSTRSTESEKLEIIKPKRLAAGDKVALINPATAAFRREEIEVATESLEALGLEVVHGDHYFNRRGYFAGSDQERASDINRFFADETVR